MFNLDQSSGDYRELKFYLVERCYGLSHAWHPVGVFFGNDLDEVIENAAHFLARTFRIKIALLRATKISDSRAAKQMPPISPAVLDQFEKFNKIS